MNACSCIDLIADLKELDSSVKMVHRALDQQDIETTSHFFAKSLGLVGVVKARMPISDMQKFDNLKAEVLGILRRKMQEARESGRKDQIEKIAVLFKNVGEQEEGMKLYTQYIM